MAKETDSMSHHPSGKPHVTSERHDVLYSKARYVLNQRHIKRPWFNLNPFLEKLDETLDLDNYFPEESKFLQRLQSLVISESFSSDRPVDTREIALEKFFEYLFSDEWEDGCSIRVLEGQLLEQLLVSLYRLEGENKAVRHTTYAVARNKRKKMGCYKQAEKEEFALKEETLLLEFAYFGRLIKDKPNEVTQNPMEYLRVGWDDYNTDGICSPNQTALPPLQGVSSSTSQGKRKSRAPSKQVDNVRAANLSESNKSDNSKRKSRGSTVTQPLNIIRCVNAFNQQQDRPPSIATASSSGTPLTSLRMSGGPQERRRGNDTYTSDDMTGCRRNTNGMFRKFCLAQNDFSPDFDTRSPMSEIDEIDDGIDTRQTKDKAFYGDEIYLSDRKHNVNKNKESTLTKLRKKKKELQQKREAGRQEMERRAKFEKTCILPPLSPLDTAKLMDSTKMHNTIKLPDTLPTFEEFIKLLKDDEYFDPRYRNKVRLKSRIIAQRYYIAKGMHQSDIMLNLDNLQDDIKVSDLTKRLRQQRNSNQALNRDRRGLNGSGSKGKIRLPEVQESGRKLSKKPDGLSNVSSSSNQRFAEEVHGVTDSEPCKEHALKGKASLNRQREERAGRLRQNAQGKCPLKSQTDLAVSGQDVNLSTLAEEASSTRLKGSQQATSSEDMKILAPPSSNLKPGEGSPFFPTVDICDDEIEPSETDESDDSDSGHDASWLFDTNKLNFRYSIERLRKKSRMKRKKPVFMDVLAKFYKVHATLKDSQKGSASPEETSARESLRRLGRLKKAKSKPKKEPEIVIGKLRQFAFNGARQKKRLNLDGLSRGEFSKPDLSSFHEDLRSAMDKFVVRREIVVSTRKVASSITFTRKSCFQKKHVKA